MVVYLYLPPVYKPFTLTTLLMVLTKLSQPFHLMSPRDYPPPTPSFQPSILPPSPLVTTITSSIPRHTMFHQPPPPYLQQFHQSCVSKKTLLCRQRCSSLGHDDYKRDGWTQTLLGVESLGCWRASYRPQHPLHFPDSHRLQHHRRAQNAARQHREAAPDGARCLRHPLRPRYPQTGGFGARSTARTIIVGALNRLFASGTGFGLQTKVYTPRKMRGRGNRSPPSMMSTEISASSSTRTPKKPVDAHRGHW
jgi:hypothetical protein